MAKKMTETTETTQTIEEEVATADPPVEEIAEKGNRFVDATRKVWWVGIGSAALAQDEAKSIVDKLVERGEIAEKEARQRIRSLTSRDEKTEVAQDEMGEMGEMDEDEDIDREKDNLFLTAPHKVLQAGLGAVAMTQESLENFTDKLIERGENAEKEGRELIDDLIAKGHNKRVKAVESEVDKQLTHLLARLNIPSKADIDDLRVKITELAEKVETLRSS